jgi:hypothetical protein
MSARQHNAVERQEMGVGSQVGIVRERASSAASCASALFCSEDGDALKELKRQEDQPHHRRNFHQREQRIGNATTATIFGASRSRRKQALGVVD